MAIVTQRSTSGPDLLGLLDGGDDAALDLGLVLVVGLVLAFGEDQRGGQAAEQGPLMAGIAAENPALYVDVAW